MLKLALIFCIAINIIHTSSSQSCSSVDQATLTLSTLNGQILGQCVNGPVKYADNYNTSADVLIWQSIPYAEPPIGKNRFRNPVPIKGQWNGTLDGRNPPKSCLQLDDPFNRTSEDCLYLNVYVEKNTYINRNKELKPILVFIHGGGFVSGSGNLYNGTTVVSMSDIIVVTINYRIEALGFLHLAGTDVTGNQGLLDTSLALRWISDNARAFGGDNTKITIKGESAGAWNVGFQLFIPASWPYFRNAIMQSGGVTGINNVAQLLTSQDATDRGKQFLSDLGCTNSDIKLALECAMQKSEAEILGSYKPFDIVALLPVIDNIVFEKSIPHLQADNAFKKCNILTGHSADEHAIFYLAQTGGYRNPQKWLEKAKNTNIFSFYEELKREMKYFPIYPYQKPFIVGKIFYEYFSANEILNIDSVNLIKRLSQIKSDQTFTCQAYQLASLYSRTGNNAFVYNFNYTLSSSSILSIFSDYFGAATHADELKVTFAEPLEPKKFDKFTQAERDFTQKIVFYWTNFAKYDNPSGVTYDSVTTWLPFADHSWGYQNEYYQTGRSLVMSNDKLAMTSGFTSHHCQFWGF